jgi:hypothetical protein
LTRTISSINTTTRRTGFTSIPRINQDYGDTSESCLVLNKTAKLEERPIGQSLPLAASSRNPFADTLEVFKSNATFGALSITHDILADYMVGVLLETSLSATKFVKFTLGSLGAFPLEIAPTVSVNPAFSVNLSTRVKVFIRVNSDINNAKVNTDEVRNFLLDGFGNITGQVKVESTVPINKVSLALSVLKHHSLVFTTHEGDEFSTIERPNRNGIWTFETQNTVVVCDGTTRLKDSLGAFVLLVGIRNLSDTTDNHLGCKPKLFFSIPICDLVKFELVECTGIPGYLTDVVTRRVSPFKGLEEDTMLLN